MSLLSLSLTQVLRDPAIYVNYLNSTFYANVNDWHHLYTGVLLAMFPFILNRIHLLRSKKGISKSKYTDVTIGLLVQKTEFRITEPPERVILSFENHAQFYNIFHGLAQGQEQNQKQYLLFS